MSSNKTSTHRSVARFSLMAHWPIARTDLRTHSMSTSDAYSRNSDKIWSMLFSEASWTMTEIFSNFTYRGSLYLHTNMRTSPCKICGCFCTIKLMFRMTTYWISGSCDKRVTNGGVIFLHNARTSSGLWILSMNFIMTLIAERTTALFACDNLAMTPRSRIVSATLEFGGSYIAIASNRKTCPHSELSLSAGNNFEIVSSFSCK
mmetsp:Transcript_39097/g.77812  ORF Transcript_39097/g.77812 Transcript_39097/m.77812 type:complete len:204 (+) Transcript_39097:307-918(+)